MYLWHLFKLILLAWAISVLNGVNCKTLNGREYPFKLCKKYQITTSILDSISSRSLLDCIVNCFYVSNCSSVNFYASNNACELSRGWVNGACSSLAVNSNSRYAELIGPCLNGGTWDRINRKCDCMTGFTGTNCYRRWRDCSEKEGGLPWIPYTIQPLGSRFPVDVFCDANTMFFNILSTVGRRDKTWAKFKDGFRQSPDMYTGLEALHQITKQGEYYLYIIITDATVKTVIKYGNVKIGSESEGYPFYYDSFDPCFIPNVGNCNIVLDGFSGVGDPTKNLNGSKFGTKDNDQFGCATANGQGWWYNTGCSAILPGSGNFPWPASVGGPLLLSSLPMRLVVVKYYEEG